ncbi:MAG: ABC transporter ATP-binding protein [Methanocorpusculum sp.]|nr:ABC transporter ATP-binding protein [Methanocorpusculum sp.]
MENAIEITSLSKNYPGFHLDNITFSLPRGSIMGFIGENGAGKTTTIKAVLGLIKKDAGTVRLLGSTTPDDRTVKEKIGVVFDECCIPDGFTVKEAEKIFSRIYRTWDAPLFAEYLRKFSLPADKKVREFSRGMKMKLSIAVALAHRPELLILDEATSGLDPVVREEILDIFLDFIQDENHAILLSSHITSDLDKIADYITFIHAGKIVFSAPRDVVLTQMGIWKCGADDAAMLDAKSAGLLRMRKNQFGCEVLIENRERFCSQYPEAVVDPATTESVMLFYVRGEEI